MVGRGPRSASPVTPTSMPAPRSSAGQPWRWRAPPAQPHSAAEQELIGRLTRAFQAGDVDGVVAPLTDDVKLAMPPVPLEYRGRELAAQFLTATGFRQVRTYRLAATRANGQPAFGAYFHDPRAGWRTRWAAGVTLAGDRVCTITRFDNGVLPRFGLPRTLPD